MKGKAQQSSAWGGRRVKTTSYYTGLSKTFSVLALLHQNELATNFSVEKVFILPLKGRRDPW